MLAGTYIEDMHSQNNLLLERLLNQLEMHQMIVYRIQKDGIEV